MNEVMRMLKQWLAGLCIPNRSDSVVMLYSVLCIIGPAVPFTHRSRMERRAVGRVFGLAKTAQYGGLAILGVDGYRRLKAKMPRLF